MTEGVGSATKSATPVRAAPPTQAKSIILFSDGTGNSSAKLFKTNVFRLYEAVDLGPPSEGKQRQIAYYDNGVGTSALRPLAMLGGIFGIGLKRNVLEIYRYACRNYDPDSLPPNESDISEKGDHIYGFGFSRGAFTMRLVIGLIADQGLVPYTTEGELQHKSKQAWKAFRRTSRRRALQWIAALFRHERPQSEAEAAARGASLNSAAEQAARKGYDHRENHWPVIRMIGVFDTVAAYGGPVTEITRAIDNWIYPLSMPNYALHPQVRCARHALALDDERDSFWPLLWDEVAERRMYGAQVDGKDAPWLREGRLQQVWFAGMHADVGGGYPDESLSYVSLLWMIEEANGCQLRTVDCITQRYVALANSFGPIHDSRSGFASYYRYQPRKIRAFLARPKDDAALTSTLGLRDPLIGQERAQKGLLETPVVHESVVARIATGTDGYAPIVLPEQYHVVPPGELTETIELKTSGDDSSSSAAEEPSPERDGGRRPAQHLAVHTPLLPPHIRDWLSPDAMAAVARAMERSWDDVWKRRAAYFLTVLATIALLTMPWWVPRPSGAAGETDLQLVWDGRNMIGNIIRLPGELLPDMAQRWIDAWANNSACFVMLTILLILFRRMGGRYQRQIRDRARDIWHAHVPRIPPATAGNAPTGLAAHQPSHLERWRNGERYQRSLQLFKWGVLPNLVFAPLLLALIVLLAGGVVTQAALPWVERSSALCGRDGSTVEIANLQVGFATADICNRTGGTVAKGDTYRITFEIVDPWRDGSAETTPGGLGAGDLRWFAGYAGIPLRRVLDAGYLEPLVAVRSKEGGFFTRLFGSVPIRRLQFQPVENRPNAYQAEYRAPTDGELFLFANDAVLLFYPRTFYQHIGANRGTACVTIVSAAASAAPPQVEASDTTRELCRTALERNKPRPAASRAAPPPR